MNEPYLDPLKQRRYYVYCGPPMMTNSDLRPLWTDLWASKIRVKTPSEQNAESHKTKTKPEFEKVAQQVLDIRITNDI